MKQTRFLQHSNTHFHFSEFVESLKDLQSPWGASACLSGKSKIVLISGSHRNLRFNSDWIWAPDRRPQLLQPSAFLIDWIFFWGCRDQHVQRKCVVWCDDFLLSWTIYIWVIEVSVIRVLTLFRGWNWWEWWPDNFSPFSRPTVLSICPTSCSDWPDVQKWGSKQGLNKL